MKKTAAITAGGVLLVLGLTSLFRGCADSEEPVLEEGGSAVESVSQEPYLSLAVFGRPYLRPVSEREFFELSPQDQEKVMAETVESLRQMRAHARDIVAQARRCMASQDYPRAEARLISSLETGRELAADKDGMFITRVVGIACQEAALNQMVTLYTETGDLVRVQTARARLEALEAEMAEIRCTRFAMTHLSPGFHPSPAGKWTGPGRRCGV